MACRPFYYRETHGIRITVRPLYLQAHSRPQQHQFVFAYFVRIENIGAQAAQLLSRRWLIHDSNGEETEVHGDGVVGVQPLIRRGHVHEYQSMCVLRSPTGFMEGHYHFVRADRTCFDAQIPRFYLEAEAPVDPGS